VGLDRRCRIRHRSRESEEVKRGRAAVEVGLSRAPACGRRGIDRHAGNWPTAYTPTTRRPTQGFLAAHRTPRCSLTSPEPPLTSAERDFLGGTFTSRWRRSSCHNKADLVEAGRTGGGGRVRPAVFCRRSSPARQSFRVSAKQRSRRRRIATGATSGRRSGLGRWRPSWNGFLREEEGAVLGALAARRLLGPPWPSMACILRCGVRAVKMPVGGN